MEFISGLDGYIAAAVPEVPRRIITAVSDQAGVTCHRNLTSAKHGRTLRIRSEGRPERSPRKKESISPVIRA